MSAFASTRAGRQLSLAEAKLRFPGVALYRCGKCGHTAAGDGQPPTGKVVHYGCGGIVALVPDAEHRDGEP